MTMHGNALRVVLIAIGLVMAMMVSVTSVVGSPLAQGSSTIVISEFRTRGPNGGNDEFIELYNRSNVNSVDISNWEIWGSNSAGTVSNRATIPSGTVLGPNCRYLLTNSNTTGGPYSGPTPGDQTYTVGITDNGGIAVCSGGCDTPANRVDQVGMSATSAYVEGTPLTPMSINQDQSYERYAAHGNPSVNTQDSDNNAADFFFNSPPTPSNPENLSSTCTLPTAVKLGNLAASSGGLGVVLPMALSLAAALPVSAFLIRRRRA